MHVGSAADDLYIPELDDGSSPLAISEADRAAGQPTGGAKLLHFIGRFHPVVVHFPIALILTALLAELLAWWTRREMFEDSGRFLTMLSAPAAVVAAALGWANAAFKGGVYTAGLDTVLWQHRWLGTGVAVLIVITAVVSELGRRRRHDGMLLAYRALLACSALMVGLTGHLGGTLLYGLNYYSW